MFVEINRKELSDLGEDFVCKKDESNSRYLGLYKNIPIFFNKYASSNPTLIEKIKYEDGCFDGIIENVYSHTYIDNNKVEKTYIVIDVDVPYIGNYCSVRLSKSGYSLKCLEIARDEENELLNITSCNNLDETVGKNIKIWIKNNNGYTNFYFSDNKKDDYFRDAGYYKIEKITERKVESKKNKKNYVIFEIHLQNGKTTAIFINDTDEKISKYSTGKEYIQVMRGKILKWENGLIKYTCKIDANGFAKLIKE